MLAIALFVSAAKALEIGFSSNSTDSSSTSTSSLTSSSSSGTTSGTAAVANASPALTSAATLPTPSCNTNYGRNCDRLPEQPYYVYVDTDDLTNSFYGFTDPAFSDPWTHYELYHTNASSAELESVTSCADIFSSSLSLYLASASITPATYVPPSAITTTVTPFTSIYTIETATGTGSDTETYTDSLSGGIISLQTVTDTEALFIETTTSTTINTINGAETIGYAGYTAYFYQSDFTFSPPPTCCSACTIMGGNIEVLYWGSATSGAVSTVTNSAGFTFTSPSVYVALQTLSATDLCGEVGSAITSGTTLSFAPHELSTAVAYSSNSTAYSFYTGWSPSIYFPATFGTEACTSITTTFWLDGEKGVPESYSLTTLTTEVVNDNTYTIIDTLQEYILTYNPCFPYLSIPQEVYTIDPLWKQCTTYWQGFALYDPPYVLSPAAGLGGFGSTTTSAPSATSPDAVVTTSANADPGSTPSSVTPPATTTPVVPTTTAIIVDPGTSVSSSPTQVDPGNPSSPAGADPGTSPVAADPGTSSSSSPPAADPGTTTPNSPTAIDPGTPASSAPAPVNQPSPNSPAAPNPVETSSTPLVATIGGQTLTADSSSAFLLGSQTLSPGGQVTLSGTTISLASNAATLIVGTSTEPLITPTYVIGTQTLAPGGPAITVSGTVYSLESGGSSVVVGGSTTALTALEGSSSGGLGNIIVTVGGFETPSVISSNPTGGFDGTTFNGAAAKSMKTSWFERLVLPIGVLLTQFLY